MKKLIAILVFATACSPYVMHPKAPAEGESAMLVRYIKGESIDTLTKSYSLDSPEETRYLLRRAMTSLQDQYKHDRRPRSTGWR